MDASCLPLLLVWRECWSRATLWSHCNVTWSDVSGSGSAAGRQAQCSAVRKELAPFRVASKSHWRSCQVRHDNRSSDLSDNPQMKNNILRYNPSAFSDIISLPATLQTQQKIQNNSIFILTTFVIIGKICQCAFCRNVFKNMKTKHLWMRIIFNIWIHTNIYLDIAQC